MVPDTVLQDFLQDAQQELALLRLPPRQEQDPLLSPATIRALLLERQASVLERVVTDYNIANKNDDRVEHVTLETVQTSLKNLDDTRKKNDLLCKLSRDLNDTARLVYAKLVLRVACERAAQQKQSLQSSGTIPRNVLLDFFALCQAAVRLPNVQQHLSKGTPLFPDLLLNDGSSSNDQVETTDKTTAIPSQRLERIQHLIMGELGYDKEFATQEIQRLFLSTNDDINMADDPQLTSTFAQTMKTLHEAVNNASLTAFSDVDRGGVTRVVAVEYSERVVDRSGNVMDSSANANARNMSVSSPQIMTEHEEEKEQQTLRAAQQTAVLQQEILSELLALSDGDRQERLAEAERVSLEVMDQVMQLPPGPERIQLLRSVDEPTQRLMAMHKLWQGHVASNGDNKRD